MKKIGLIIREEAGAFLEHKIQGAEGIILVGYCGLSAADLNLLRNSLNSAGASLLVIKNNIGKRLLKPYPDLSAGISGPCGLIIVNKEIIAIAQAIDAFAKKNANLEVKSGLLKERIISREEIKTLAGIPSLAALHCRVTTGLKSPIFGFVLSLKQILNKLVWALGQIKEKKSKKD